MAARSRKAGTRLRIAIFLFKSRIVAEDLFVQICFWAKESIIVSLDIRTASYLVFNAFMFVLRYARGLAKLCLIG